MKRVTVTAEFPDGTASLVQEVVADGDTVAAERRLRRRLGKVPEGTTWATTVDEHTDGAFW